jgi:hypothetical protein
MQVPVVARIRTNSAARLAFQQSNTTAIPVSVPLDVLD